MKRTFLAAAAVGAPLLISLFLLGCGKPKGDDDSSGDEKKGAAPTVATKTEELKPLPSKPGATLKGKVTLKGAAPDIAALTAAYQQNLKKPEFVTTCFDTAPETERTEPVWHIGADNGVSDAVVWIQPPEGYYFEVDKANKTWPDKVELSQPHCAFIPHINWAMPMVPDAQNPKKMIPSGQEFLVSNLAKVSHNTVWKTETGPSNSGEEGVIPAGTGAKKVSSSLKAGKDPGLVHFSCNIHNWMDAYIWVFDHPYVAITDKDGNYEIKNVPVGSKVRVVGWHEKADYLAPGKKGEEMMLNDGANEKNFEVEVKGQ
jgi:hypothetical protein